MIASCEQDQDCETVSGQRDLHEDQEAYGVGRLNMGEQTDGGKNDGHQEACIHPEDITEDVLHEVQYALLFESCGTSGNAADVHENADGQVLDVLVVTHAEVVNRRYDIVGQE